MPRNEDKTFDLYAVLPWLRKRWVLESREDGATNKSSPALEAFRRARADLVALDLAQRRGELVETQAVAHEWSRLLTEFKNGLLGLPNRLALRLEGQSAQVIAGRLGDAIRGEIDRIRDRYLAAAQAADTKNKVTKTPHRAAAKRT